MHDCKNVNQNNYKVRASISREGKVDANRDNGSGRNIIDIMEPTKVLIDI